MKQLGVTDEEMAKIETHMRRKTPCFRCIISSTKILREVGKIRECASK